MVPCPGSVQMAEKYPEPESTSAQDGNAAHWAGAEILRVWKKGGSGSLPSAGVKADNGIILTNDMVDAAGYYARSMIKEAIIRGAMGSLHIEQKVYASRIHPESWGTVDSFLYDHTAKEVIVPDFKYGWGIIEPFENWQLINYTAGIAELLDLPEGTTVKIRVAQPRPYHVEGCIREWSIKLIDLRGLFNILSHSAHVALQPDPPIKSGPHCAYCSARHVCPAAQKAALAGVEYSETASIIELPPEALGAEIAVLRRVYGAVGYRLTALETEALSLIKKGIGVTGLAVGPGQGKTVWSRSVTEVIKLGADRGVELRKPEDVITPLQAEKAGLRKEDLKGYSERKPGSLKLIKATDTIAAKAFKK